MSTPETTMTDDLIGKTIGGYEILDVIGRGGMATVYRAQQVSMNRIVAVKVLPEKYLNDDTYIQRFNQEVAIVAKLEHRNIVPVYDYGEYNGLPYIVMRYMSGGSVDDLLAKGPLEIEQIVSIIEQIAPALDYAHSKHVLHRDLKPSNVLLDDDGGAYLTDFGIARVLSEQRPNVITTQGVVGTPSYMSPEQAQGLALDSRSDIYSLGIMLFELATGRRPFEADTPYGIAVLQVTTPPPSPRIYNPSLSFAVEEVIYKSLKKKPGERYPHAVGLAEGLKRAVNKPVASIHDTQPGMSRSLLPQPSQVPVQPAFSAPAPAIPANAIPPSQSYVPSYRPRRRRGAGSSVWVSAALGGVLGCGVLAVLVVVVMLLVSSVNSPAPATASVSSTPAARSSGAIATLDATSEAGRATLVPASGALSLPTPTIMPVGVRAVDVSLQNLNANASALIFFAERDSNVDLYRLNLATGAESRLTFDAAVDSHPAVSPDGRLIAFQSGRDGDLDIYVMAADGEDLRQLTSNTFTDNLPSWSPDGEWIIFSSDVRGDATFDLFAIRPDGTQLHPIFSNGQRNSHARYGPDGQYLIFTTGLPADGATWEVGRLETADSMFSQLTDNAFMDWSPVVSPDGTALLFLTAEEGRAAGDSAIALLTINGAQRRILFDGPGYEWSPAYSPDGAFISFTTYSDRTGLEEVFVMKADGTGVQQVTDKGGQGAVWLS